MQRPYLAALILVAFVCGCHAGRRGAVNPAPPRVAIENTSWKLVEIGGAPVVVAEGAPAPHVTLIAGQKRLWGSGGCNQIMGSYVVAGHSLRFAELATTRKQCAQGMAEERQLLAALEAASAYEIAGDSLALYGGGKAVLARFTALFSK